MHARYCKRCFCTSSAFSALRPCPTGRNVCLLVNQNDQDRQERWLTSLSLGGVKSTFALVSDHVRVRCESFNPSRKVMNRTEPKTSSYPIANLPGFVVVSGERARKIKLGSVPVVRGSSKQGTTPCSKDSAQSIRLSCGLLWTRPCL